MPSKVNIVLDDDVKSELDALVEAGFRSRVINTALRKELTLLRRRQLSTRLDTLRAKTKAMSSKQIGKMIQKDRGR
jgi:Arc/MetJ-type ribon-helix-helix transcriptional regulator